MFSPGRLALQTDFYALSFSVYAYLLIRPPQLREVLARVLSVTLLAASSQFSARLAFAFRTIIHFQPSEWVQPDDGLTQP